MNSLKRLLKTISWHIDIEFAFAMDLITILSSLVLIRLSSLTLKNGKNKSKIKNFHILNTKDEK